MMPSSPGHVASLPYTNGHLSPLAAHMTTADSSSPQADSDLSDAREAAAADQASDVDAPGEEYDEDEEMAAASDSSEDVDAEGEPDGDYDSDSPPSERAESNRARSSSEESTRPTKRKASDEKEYPMEQNPELYGLRRSVDSSDEDDDYSSDQPRKRQRTASRKTSNQPTPVYRSAGSDSESDGYVGARRNIPTKKQRQRQHAVATGREPPSQAEVRFSARRTAQVANYNEEEDEDEFIEEDDEMTPNYWATATEDTGPVIDKILDHRPKDGSEIDPSFEKKDFEYLIKWQDKAHYHSSWEDYKTAASYKGYRKLDNYFKGPVSSDMYFHSRKDEDPEEFEQHMVAREAERESQLDFHVVERVIDSRDGEDETDYFVKWKGLTYEFCTWEPASLMGLGKTVQTVSFINWLRHDRHQDGPMICVVPLSTMPAWADTFNNWTPDVNYVIYTGREEARAIIRDKELLVDGNTKKIKFNVLLTTYEYVLADWQFLQSIKWQFLAVDEAHRLKNRDSQLYDRLRQFNAPCRLLITGTPIQNTLGELAALMDFLMPGKITVDEHVDLASEDASQKLAELSSAIQPYMIRRTKEKVENDLPPKSEKILRVELSDIQLEYYKNILTRNYEALNEGGVGHKQSLLNIVMELKKASNHALLFPNAENKLVKPGSSKEETLKALITSSGKMMLLDRLLGKLKADGHRVLIFSQMVHMLDILTDYLKLRNYSFQRLDGTVPAADRKIAIDHFNAPGSEDYCFLLSTRAGGLGINLMTADTVVIFDSDWNPQADLQAMARAHRIGQQKPVSVYRLVSKDTIEEEILERARNKRMLEFITIQRGVTDRQQKELNDKMSRAAAEPNSADDINNILKRRGQKMFEQSGNQKKLEELDIDSVLENAEEHKTEQAAGLTSDGGEEFLKNFEYTDVKIDLEWDDIIPKEELEAVKADIQQRKDEEETQKLLEESAPRKRKAVSSSAREQRAAKKRALEATHIDVDDDEQSEQDDTVGRDPKRPLNTKEVRNLIGAYYRYGSLDERADEMLQSAKLVGRDLNVVKATLDQIVAESTRLVKEEQTRLKNLEIEAKRAITKKDKKAVLFDFGNVKKVNAETILERPVEMRILKEAVEATSDWRNFRVPDAIKPASYSCPWGAREDGMLCIGIQRHGYGAWVNIRDDPELGLTDKFYLEEHRVDKKEERTKAEEKNAKSPGAVHLVRRANYLLTVLKDKSISDPSVKRLMENHHRNNKKNHLNAARRTDKANSVSASPAPSGPMRKMASRDSERPSQRTYSNGENRRPDTRTESRQYDRSRDDRPRNSDQYRPSDGHRKEYRNDRGSVDRRGQTTDRNGTPENRRKISGDVDRQRIRDDRPRLSEDRPRSHSQSQVPDRSVETAKAKEKKPDDFLERKLRPVRDNLSRLKKATPKNYPQKDAMVKVLKTELIAIGNFIRAETRDNPELEERLWGYTITNHWPRPGVTVPAIKGMYNKMLSSEKPAAGTTATNGQKNGA
ncbi:hypothetical protein CFE70_002096 [Pyrenophora teres f. teres 0-1]